VLVNFGFIEKPDIPEALKLSVRFDLVLDIMETSYFLGRETLIPKVGSEMVLWREKLFISMFKKRW
jgi:KUP system potassium uptake protein